MEKPDVFEIGDVVILKSEPTVPMTITDNHGSTEFECYYYFEGSFKKQYFPREALMHKEPSPISPDPEPEP